MRIHWGTKKYWCWFEITVWWKSFMFGCWFDNWDGVNELDFYFMFWTISFRWDKKGAKKCQ